MKLSATQINALKAIDSQAVYITNRGSVSVKGVSGPTVASLRKAKLVDVNGASRVTDAKGRTARRLVIRSAARAYVAQRASESV